MKIAFIGLVVLVLIIFGCRNVTKSDSKKQLKEISIKDLQMAEVRDINFTENQKEAIRYIFETFKEVNDTPYEVTESNFKRDLNPNREIVVWLSMASLYEFYKEQNRELSKEHLEEVFKLILLRSMMPLENVLERSDLKYIKREQAEELLSKYGKLEIKDFALSASEVEYITSVESALELIDEYQGSAEEFKLRVKKNMTWQNKELPMNVGMTIIGDKILKRKWMPNGRDENEKGFIYHYKEM